MKRPPALLVVALLIGAVALFVLYRGMPKPEKSPNEESTSEKPEPGDRPHEAPEPAKRLVDEVNPTPPAVRPDPIAPSELTRYYPVGKVVRSEGSFEIIGQGTNESWFYKHGANFEYVYDVVAETRVVKNQGANLVFEQDFPNVSQIKFEVDSNFELKPNPIVQLVWETAKVAPPIVSIPCKIFEGAKPELEALAGRWLAPLSPEQRERVAVQTAIESLSGRKLEIHYTNGIGITKVRIIAGEKLEKSDLELIAANLRPLSDYFAGKINDASVGETRELKLEDVSGVVPIGLDYDVTGILRVKKTAETPPQHDFSVVYGVARVMDSFGRRSQEGTLKLTSGEVTFDSDQQFVRHFWAKWEAKTLVLNERHLLWETKTIRNLAMQSTYKAEVVLPGGAARKANDTADGTKAE